MVQFITFPLSRRLQDSRPLACSEPCSAQSGAPLLIDQPEEDLDNEQIHLLSEQISETKHNRQLLFVSHNANIVVNGDAELVVCFAYQESKRQYAGKIGPVGSIDCPPVLDTITSVMEVAGRHLSSGSRSTVSSK